MYMKLPEIYGLVQTWEMSGPRQIKHLSVAQEYFVKLSFYNLGR